MRAWLRFDLARAGQFTDTTTDATRAPELPLDGLTPAPEIEPAPTVITAAAGDPEPAPAGPDTWHAVIIVEGQRSTDGREIMPGALSARTLPLPLMYLTTTTWGHDGAQLGGQILTIDRDPNTGDLLATGIYADTDEGRELQGLVNTQLLRWVSADLEIVSYEYVYDGSDGYCDPCCDSPDAMRVTEGNVMGATVCPFPAFPQCVIGPPDLDLDAARTAGQDAAQELGMVDQPVTPIAIAAAAGPLVPPASWFENPTFGTSSDDDPRLVEDPDYPGFFACPLTVLDDGRVFGHGAAWHRPHIGYGAQRVTPPRSNTDYANYATGAVQVRGTDGLEMIRCGVITMSTGHAETSGPRSSIRDALAHYDNTGTGVADVEVGEDEHGIWIAGALRSTVTEEQIRELRAASLSGDWRPIGTNLEAVAFLAVNTPGFGIPRPRGGFKRIEGTDRELALVAAGIVPPRDPMGDLARRIVREELAEFHALFDELRPLAVERLAARIRP